jgi:hypothetical protein
MPMRNILLLILLTVLPIQAADTCSRTAIVNGQRVLVDTNYSERGEGLRFQLSKDPIAEKYLNDYQEGTRLKWQNTALGTIGTILILSGILTSSDNNKRRSLLIGGASVMTVNFLLYKTLENTNESNLKRSIQEYNKRNSPKIFFEDDIETKKDRDISISFTKSWSF